MTGLNKIPVYIHSPCRHIASRASLTKKCQEFNFMFGGSDIISENEGRLAEFFEKLKKTYIENGGTKYDFI